MRMSVGISLAASSDTHELESVFLSQGSRTKRESRFVRLLGQLALSLQPSTCIRRMVWRLSVVPKGHAVLTNYQWLRTIQASHGRASLSKMRMNA